VGWFTVRRAEIVCRVGFDARLAFGIATEVTLHARSVALLIFAGATELTLYRLFSRFGGLVSCHTLLDPSSGLCRGVGFVNYASSSTAIAAMSDLNGTRPLELGGRQLHISLQPPRAQRLAARSYQTASKDSQLAQGLPLPPRRHTVSHAGEQQQVRLQPVVAKEASLQMSVPGLSSANLPQSSAAARAISATMALLAASSGANSVRGDVSASSSGTACYPSANMHNGLL
jgi:hypothetical protein